MKKQQKKCIIEYKDTGESHPILNEIYKDKKEANKEMNKYLKNTWTKYKKIKLERKEKIIIIKPMMINKNVIIEDKFAMEKDEITGAISIKQIGGSRIIKINEIVE